MRIHRFLILAALSAASCGLLSASGCSLTDINVGGTFPYVGNGCFNQDADEQSFLFSLGAVSYNFLAFTSQWGDRYGFAPVLSLYNADTNALVMYDNTAGDPALGTCGGRIQDPTQYGTCLDAYIGGTLAAGNYRLVLTEWNNYGPSTYDPTQFSEYGNGNFTGDSNHWAVGGSFLSPVDSTQRSNFWGVTITDTPEPVTGLLGLSGLLVTLVAARRRRTDRS